MDKLLHQIRCTEESLRNDSLDPTALLEQVRRARVQASQARAAIEELQRQVLGILEMRAPGRAGPGEESSRL